MSKEEKIKQAIELLKTNPAQAAEVLDDILADTPNNIDALYNKGMALAALKQYQDAINYFLKVLQLNPKAALAHVSIANIANTCAQPMQAIQRYVAAINADNSLLPHFYQWLGTTALQASQRALALKAEDLIKAREEMAAAGKAYEVMSQHPSPEVKETGAYHAGILFDMLEHERGVEFLQKCKTHEPFKTYAESILKMKECTHKGTEKKTLIVHAGFFKTATTWFQNAFFPYLPGISHIGETFFTLSEPNAKMVAFYGFPTIKSTGLTRKMTGQDFDINEFKKLAEQLFQKNDIISISDEAMAGGVGGLAENLVKIKEEMDIDVKVFMMIRNQKDLIKSTYLQNIKAAFWPEKSIDKIFEDGHEQIEKYDFLKVYNSLKPFAGGGNLLMLPFEMMKENNVACLTKIAEFYGVNEAASFAEACVRIPPVNERSTEAEAKANMLSPDMDDVLSDMVKPFADENRELEEKICEGLGGRGYF